MQTQYNTFELMDQSTARQLVEELNVTEDKIFRARTDKSRSRLEDLKNEIMTKLEQNHVQFIRICGSWRVEDTEEEALARKEQIAAYSRQSLVKDLESKKTELASRLTRQEEYMAEMRRTLAAGRTDFWQLTSSNWIDINRLAAEITTLTSTLQKLGVLDE